MTTDEGGDQEALIAALVAELTDARWRGLDRLDRRGHGQEPVAVPNLEELARRYADDEQSDRILLIRRLLADALDAWERDDNGDEATFVRGLFFHADGGSSGRHKPHELLLAVRGDMGEDAFRRRREDLFRRFAVHLLAYVPARQPGATAATPPPPARNPRTVLLVSLVLLAAVGAAVVLGLRSGGPTPGPASGGATLSPATPVVPTRPDGSLLKFRFDGLGGGNPIIRVFPAATETVAANGRYNSRDEVPALCKTSGQLVPSKPSVGERARESDVWVRIVGSPGETRYARLTYGDMTPEDLAALPQC